MNVALYAIRECIATKRFDSAMTMFDFSLRSVR